MNKKNRQKSIGTTTSCNAQPASRVVSSTAQPFIFSKIIRFLAGCLSVEVGPGPLGATAKPSKKKSSGTIP
ncbi:hypothetical protein NHF39_16800 [Pseudomonas proteolytica]|nr:hypothetical protein NHF39_16800 [Pseudomonas proteolytica]